MGNLKDTYKDKRRSYGSAISVSKNYVAWFNESFDNRLDHTVDRLGPTDVIQKGKMYKFLYSPITKGLTWHDKNPLIISLGQVKFQNGLCEAAINLNVLPYNIKIDFLDDLYTNYKSIIDSQISGRNANNAKNQFDLGLDWDSIGSLVDKYYLGIAFRYYKKTNIKKLACISYEHWDSMMLIESYSFENFSVGSIEKNYKEYIINKKKNKLKK